jgi:cold shock CspA family protein
MKDIPSDARGEMKTGKVSRLLGEYGFLSAPDLPDQDVYFKTSWFRGAPPLREGEEVTFQLKTYGANLQASSISRAAEAAGSAGAGHSSAAARQQLAPPLGTHIFDWAYLGYLPNTLSELASLALPERWEFQNAPRNQDRPLPILASYLIHTFGRLVLERKVLVNENASCAAFNTGLVDPRYEPIHALFTPNDDPHTRWQLAGFCIPGEGADGQNLVRHFNPLPTCAHYFANPVDLLYDARVGKPELDWRHIIIERIDRYPADFLDDHWPPSFKKRKPDGLPKEERKAYYEALGQAIESDSRTYRRIMNRVKDAVDLSIKRVSWNFKTAVATYYPRIRKLQLLLPVCLISDDKVDLALAVEKTPTASYLGHTVLTLDWA